MSRARATRMDPPGEALHALLQACARGELAPNVALAQLIARAETEEMVQAALAAAQRQAISSAAAQRLAAAEDLWRETPQAWAIIKQVLSHADHARAAGSAAEWAATFDSAARISPEASAALYSLGRSDLMDAAAQDIVRRLRSWGLIGPERVVLDLGCGPGRTLAALSQHVRLVVGTDVSTAMLAAARRWLGAPANVCLVQTDGRDLAMFADGVFDLVLAADVFPYLVQCAGDLAARHFAEAGRVLAPGGSLLILNYAYGGDDAADATEAATLADQAGLLVVRISNGDFELWDGRTFHFRRRE
jgi:SAM-dependent methyltransferase